jgi:hypothetical protein
MVHYRRRPARFSALHFDNPIYRRTTEDLEAELENPGDMVDNSLGGRLISSSIKRHNKVLLIHS